MDTAIRTPDLRYSGRKIGPQGEAGELDLDERTRWSEAVASTTLAGAVIVSVLAFAASARSVFPFFSTARQSGNVSGILGGCALLLAVLSAASRAYRAGHTLPDEPESYEEYCDRIREIKAVFKNVTTDEDKLRQLEQLGGSGRRTAQVPPYENASHVHILNRQRALYSSGHSSSAEVWMTQRARGRVFIVWGCNEELAKEVEHRLNNKGFDAFRGRRWRPTFVSRREF